MGIPYYYCCCYQKIEYGEQTIDLDFHAVGAEAVRSLTDVDAVVVGLYVDNSHLVPDLVDVQHLTVA